MEIKIRNMWFSASYTVEAAFIVPMILGIIFALIYFLYYEHDKCVLHGNMQKEVLQIIREGQELPDKEEWTERMQENLWLAQIQDAKISKNALAVKAFGKAKMNLRIPVMEFFLEGQQSLQYTVEIQTWHPEQFVRWKGIIPGSREQTQKK